MIIQNCRAEELVTELKIRYENLMTVLVGRPLKSKFEGVKHGCWSYPDKLRVVDETKRNLAIADFKSILAEIGRLRK